MICWDGVTLSEKIESETLMLETIQIENLVGEILRSQKAVGGMAEMWSERYSILEPENDLRRTVTRN